MLCDEANFGRRTLPSRAFSPCLRTHSATSLCDVEYDENLRVDSVATSIETLAEFIRNTYQAHQTDHGAHVDFIVQLLGVQAATVPVTQSVPPEIGLVLAGLSDSSSRLGALEEQQVRLSNASGSTAGFFGFASGSESQNSPRAARGLLDVLVGPSVTPRENDRVGIASLVRVTIYARRVRV